MCFSPTASFGAGIALAATGAVALYRSHTKPQRALAFIPLIFALQQCTEGVVWLSLLHAEWAGARQAATYAFLFFAQIAWPVYIPLCALLFEQEQKRKTAIRITWATGIALGFYTAVLLVLHPPVAIAEQHHIRYVFDFALAQQWYYGILYFIPTVLALLLSTVKPLHWLGYLFLASYLCTRLFFRFYLISVWCFFGAIISVVVLLLIRKIDRSLNNRIPQLPL